MVERLVVVQVAVGFDPHRSPQHRFPWQVLRIAGLILAGGQARRMGGRDKALLDLAGRPLLAHVAERLAGQVGPIAIGANGDPARFAPFGFPVLPDQFDQAGPLAGVLGGPGVG